jgi:signal transduction histidine kinase
VADGLVALLVASASFVAGAEDLFHGGYPISWIGVAAYSKGLVGAVIAALILSVHQVVAFAVEGERTIVATTGNVVFVVFAVILGWAFDSLRKNDRLRRQAELRLEEEQAQRARHEERVELANQLHDSVLQTLQVIRLDADDPERVRYLARRQDRELRRLIYAFSQPYEDSFLAALLAARDTVEDLYPVEINVVIRDDAEMDAGLEAVVDATKEALVNAAKHSGADHIDLYAEIGDDGVRVFVRDRGAGFDTSSTERGHGLTYSIENRLRAVGGRVVLASTPGEGTELEISIGGDE